MDFPRPIISDLNQEEYFDGHKLARFLGYGKEVFNVNQVVNAALRRVPTREKKSLGELKPSAGFDGNRKRAMYLTKRGELHSKHLKTKTTVIMSIT